MANQTAGSRPAFERVSEASGIPISQSAAIMFMTRYAFAAELAAGRRTLEIACASGPGLRMLSETASGLVGMDINAPLLRRAAAHYGTAVPLVQGSALDLPFHDGVFDFVLCLEATYYLPDFDRALDEIVRVSSTRGRILFVNANPERPDFIRSPHSVHYHSADEFRQRLEARGWSVRALAGYPLAAPASGAGAVLTRAVKRAARRTLEGVGLVPRSMVGRARLKRLLGIRQAPLPPELTPGYAPVAAFSSVPPGPVTGFEVVVIVAERTAG